MHARIREQTSLFATPPLSLSSPSLSLRLSLSPSLSLPRSLIPSLSLSLAHSLFLPPSLPPFPFALSLVRSLARSVSLTLSLAGEHVRDLCFAFDFDALAQSLTDYLTCRSRLI